MCLRSFLIQTANHLVTKKTHVLDPKTLSLVSKEEPTIAAEPKYQSPRASTEEPKIDAERKFKFEACACDDVKKKLCSLSEQVEQLLRRQDQISPF